MSDLDHYSHLPGDRPPVDLIRSSVEACDRAYSPYSAVDVGVTVTTESGGVYTGANIENASYGATICAERSALAAAVMHEGAPLSADRIVVVGRPGDFFSPCGICRQVIAELAPTATVHFVYDGHWEALPATELLPKGFSL